MEDLTGFLGSLEFDTSIYLWLALLLVPLAIFIPWFWNRKGLGIRF
jgi:hypothetical protein